MAHSSPETTRDAGSAARSALLIVILASIVAALFFFGGRQNPQFAEASYSDDAPSGMKMVPASCESNPPYRHAVGECDAACSPQYFCSGSNVHYRAANCQELNVQACPHGCLAGKCTGATCTSGNFCSGPSLFTRDSSCNVTLVENCSGGCANGQCITNNGFCAAAYFCTGSALYYRSSNCDEQKIQDCTAGCAGASCLLPANPLASIAAVPTLVRTGGTSMITWTSTSTVSCTVNGTNGDSWTGVGGSQETRPIVSQTVYTLDCAPSSGAAHLIRQATINILPVFEEQ